MARKELTRDEFLSATGGPPHHEEFHLASGAVCQWTVGDKVYEEHQPDIGKVAWYEFSQSH